MISAGETRPDIKLGICGEHGGEPESVKFCHQSRPRLRKLQPFPGPHSKTGRRPSGPGLELATGLGRRGVRKRPRRPARALVCLVTKLYLVTQLSPKLHFVPIPVDKILCRSNAPAAPEPNPKSRPYTYNHTPTLPSTPPRSHSKSTPLP